MRNLKTFIKISELLNFTKAAEALGYSQSAVTLQMQSLEAELGVPLFDRIGKKIKLTQYGESFISYADAVLEAMEKAADFSKNSKEIKGSVRVGMVDSILNACFITIFPEFNLRFPNINLNVFVGSAREIEAKARANEIDIVYMLDYKMPSKEWVRIREEVEPIVFVTNPLNPLANEAEVPFERIIQEKLILMPPGEGYRYLFDDELAKRNLYATPSVEIASTDIIAKLMKQDIYVTILPLFAVRNELKTGELKQLKVSGCDMYQWSQLAYLKGKAVTPPLQAFIDTSLELLPRIKDAQTAT